MAEKLLFGASVADDAQVNQHFSARRDTALEFQTDLLSQLYMPFNKSMLALVPFRMEYGRESPKLFDRWVSDLQSISEMRIHQIFSQTVSDIAHVKYFTGVTATYLPSVCMHVGDILSMEIRDILRWALMNMRRS